MANYPTSLPSSSPATHQVVLDEVIAIATELGLNPSASYATVLLRLADLARRGDAIGISYASGLWHSPYGCTQGTSTAGSDLNNLVVSRWDFPPGFQITGLGEAIATAATAASGAVRKLCVYNDDGTGCYPGTLLIDGGTAYSVESTGTKTQTFAAVTVEGTKWVGGVTQVSAAALQYRTLNEMGRGMAMAAISDVQWTGYVHAGVSGAFPGTFTATRAISTSAPKVYVQAA